MKESFVLYTSQYEAIAELSAQQKGELFDALFQYVSTGEEPQFTDREIKMAFNFMRIQIDRDSNKYEDTCNKRREAVNKRWEKVRKMEEKAAQKEKKTRKRKQADTKVSEPIQEDTNDTNDTKVKSVIHNDNDNEYDNDNDGNTMLSHSDTSNIETKKEKEKKEREAVEEEKRFVNFLKYFNQQIEANGSSIKPCKQLDDERREALRLIFRKYTPEQMMQAVRNMMYSNFANGRTGSRKKAADIDWLLQPKNFKHAYEGSL